MPPINRLWDRRLRRAEALQTRWPFAAEVLAFFQAVTAFQRDAFGRIVAAGAVASGEPDTARIISLLPPLLELAESEGPPALARWAVGCRSGEAWVDWPRALREAWTAATPSGDPLAGFFTRAVLQPWAVACRERAGKPDTAPADSHRVCPFCRHLPVVSALREDREAGAVARSLVCSLCAHEWGVPRIACPGCGTEDPERLPRYTAEEIPWVRVEACDTCGRYLKAVDLSADAEAEPVADEIGSTPLDVVARERGYVKLHANLAGV